jgi:hypothetical protein
MALHLDASKMRFMYPSNKRGSVRTTSDLLPFYAYLNHLFTKMMTHREGDSSNISSYNHNIHVAMAPRPHGFDFCVFDFIWEEIKAILESPLKSCGYAPYIIHMIERVMARTFGYDKEHHPLRIKNDLRAPVERTRAATSPPRAARRSGQQGDKPPFPIQKIFILLFGMCKSHLATDVKAQHERHARKKDTKLVKEIHSHLHLQPPRSPIASEGEESLEIESFEERIAHFDVETLVQQWYGDASFNGFGFDYGGTASASSCHPPSFASPPRNDEENEESKEGSEEDE